MPQINLKYGVSQIPFEYDENRFEVLGTTREDAALTDAALGAKLDVPVDSKPFEEIVSPGESVLIVVPDATRAAASGQVVNLLVRRLIANGTMPFDIRIIFATGIHRQVTEVEKQTILTPFIVQRIKTLDHNPRDLAQIVRLGETADGTPIELNRALIEHDHTIIVGGVTFHYFAGFTGGRKLICPGLASSRTVAATHKLAFDCERKMRRAGVGAGILDKNAVHEAFMEVVKKRPPAFSINTIVNYKGEAADLFCGDWISSYRAACDSYASAYTIEIAEKRDLVIVSGGGLPFDTNLIQAHKALDAAAAACSDDGTIIFLAECADGLGKADFLDWFQAKNSDAAAEKLCDAYQVNGQTAWSLLSKAEKFNIRIITSLAGEETRPMRLQKVESLDEALAGIDAAKRGYIVPFGAKFLIKER